MANQKAAARFLPRLAALLALVVLGITADPGAPRDHRGATAAGLADRPQGAEYATAEIEELIAKYAAAVNREPVDIDLASSVWSNTPEVSLIYPLGEERGWEQVKRNFYEHTMEARFSERTLTPHDIRVHAYGDSGWAEFSWSFVGKSRKDGSRVETNGLETQIYQKVGSHRWVLVHVHYSAMPPPERTGTPADHAL
jgi:ketosteroid isomerase-like protein